MTCQTRRDSYGSGPPDNEPVLLTIARDLLELNRRCGARLTLIGTTCPSLGALERIIDRYAWSEQVQHDALATADVGLMPLHDDPYSRGKCGYKLLQYAAAGLPAVASPVGTNASILAALQLPGARSRATGSTRSWRFSSSPTAIEPAGAAAHASV